MHSSAYPACYKLTVITDKETLNTATNSSGTALVTSNGSGQQYSDGSPMYLELQKTCGVSDIEATTFTISGHL